MHRKCLLLVLAMSFQTFAQESARPDATLTEILRRLDALEHENRELLNQVHELREQLNPAQAKQEQTQNQDQATLEERVDVNAALQPVDSVRCVRPRSKGRLSVRRVGQSRNRRNAGRPT